MIFETTDSSVNDVDDPCNFRAMCENNSGDEKQKPARTS